MKIIKTLLLYFVTFIIITNGYSQITDGEYFIVSKINHYGLSSQKIDGTNSLRLLSQNNSDITRQIWVIKNIGKGYKITNKKTGEAIDVFDSSQEEASKISLYASSVDNSDNQTWNFEKSDQGNSYYLKAKHSGQYLSVENEWNQAKEGFGFTQYTKSLSNPNQLFCLLSANSKPVNYENLLNVTPNIIDNTKRQYTIYPVPSANAEGARMNRNAPCDVVPAGVYLKKGESISITANGIVSEAQNFEVLVGELNHFFTWDEKNNPFIVTLKNGENKFTSPREGLVYFRYLHHAFLSAIKPPVTLKINSGGQLSPLFIHNITTPNEWKQQLLSQSKKVQIMGNKGLITVNRSTFNKNPSVDVAKTLPILDNILTLSNDFAGFDNSSYRNLATQLKTHYVEDNISTDTVYQNGVYMFAADGFVGMQSESIFDLLNPTELQKKWAIWHETGHLYQDNDWTFNTTGEVTVNLFSLFVQESFGEPLRIFEREDGGKTMVEKAKSFLGTPNHEFLNEEKFEDMVWIRLIMFQQLKQHFGKPFYSKLFQYYRNNPIRLETSEEEKIQQFIQRSSLVSNTNLVGFYKKWGLPISKETTNIISKLKLSNAKTDISQIFMD